MTYRKLLDQLRLLSDEQLDQTATVLEGDGEFYEIQTISVSDDSMDQLDPGHVYLCSEG